MKWLIDAKKLLKEIASVKWESRKDYDMMKGIITTSHNEVLDKNFWTPCSERPPEENEFYLATIYSEEMQTAFCDKLFYGVPQLCEDKKIGWYFIHDNGDAEQVFNVKAWMQSPDLWKEEIETV